MAPNNFADRLIEAIKDKKNPAIVGLDPDFSKIPGFLKKMHSAKHGKTFEAVALTIFDFNSRIIEAVNKIVPAVKLQAAFYEQYGPWGVWAMGKTAKAASAAKLVVLIDGKRNDIGNTSQAYADGFLGKVDVFGEKKRSFDADALTVNAYLGSDSITPFIKVCKEDGSGIFVLVKTSNPSSSELQDQEVNGKKVYEIMAENVNKWGQEVIGERGYSSVGAVVGATFPEQAKTLRKLMPKAIFLVPGYGAQGGGADDVVPCFNEDGRGAIVNSSRGIIFAYQNKGNDETFALFAKEAAEQMKEDLNASLNKAGIHL